MLITIGSLKLALGVEWSLATSRGEARALAKEAGKGPITILPGDEGQVFVGHYGHGKVRGRVYSAAAVLGLVVPDSIICQSISDAVSWICVLQGGRPIPHQEQLCKREEAEQALKNLMGMHSHQYFGDQAGSSGRIEDLIQSVEAGLRDRTISKKLLQQCELKAQGVSSGLVLGAALTIALVAGGTVGWQQFKRYQLTQTANNAKLAQARQAMMTAEERAAQQRQLQAQFDASVAAKRAELEADALAGRAVPLFSQANATRQQLPLSAAGGWSPTSVKCVPASCTVGWEGRGRFVLSSTKSALVGEPVTDGTMTTTTTYPITAAAGVPVISSYDPAAFRLYLAEVLARVPGVSVGSPQAVTVMPPQGLAAAPVTVGYTGQVTYGSQAGTGLLSAHAVAAVLDRFPVRVNSVEFAGLRQSLRVGLDATYVIISTR